MSYMAAQALLKTQLLTLTSTFASTDVTEGDYRILDGGGPTMAVLIPGSIPQIDLAGMNRTQEYECIIELFVRVLNTDTTFAHNSLGTARDAIIANLASDPILSETYFMIMLRSDGEIDGVYDTQNNDPFHLTQRLVVTFQEQI